MKLIVHNIRLKPLTPYKNSTVQVGKPEDKNYVTSYTIQNIGRNSVIRIAGPEGNPYTELHPGDTAFTVGVEWPCVLRHTLTIVFVEENQQQWTDAGIQPALDPESRDINNPAAVIHQGVLTENAINLDESCLT